MNDDDLPNEPSGYATDWTVTQAERTGADFRVTLLVSGVAIAGSITSWKRYERWRTEVVDNGPKI